ncbi:MAG: hypothetical protein LBJ23_02230 [Tannerella sp.]|jgi:hypothetical protein|nr:hypothetical protein [Tannerella sp.]
MKRTDVKKVLIVLTVVSIICSAGSLQAQIKGEALLEKYGDSRQVNPGENKLGLAIEGISTEKENRFLVEWKWASDVNDAFIASRIYFIDANDFSNYKGALSSEFRGNIGDLEKMIVTLDKPAASILVYFQGIDASVRGGEPYLTSPLFFMADLGANPRLLEKTPRKAGELFNGFDETLKAASAK